MEKHFTASVYILDPLSKVLLIFHKKLQKWIPPGGHLEPNETPDFAARREVLEETGYEIEFLLQENIWISEWNANSIPRPYLCLLEEIPAFGNAAPHQHIDLVYVAKSKDSKREGLYVSEKQMRWFSLDEMKTLQQDEIFQETIQVFESIQKLFAPSF